MAEIDVYMIKRRHRVVAVCIMHIAIALQHAMKRVDVHCLIFHNLLNYNGLTFLAQCLQYSGCTTMLLNGSLFEKLPEQQNWI